MYNFFIITIITIKIPKKIENVIYIFLIDIQINDIKKKQQFIFVMFLYKIVLPTVLEFI